MSHERCQNITILKFAVLAGLISWLLCGCGGGSISTEGNAGPKNYILGRVVDTGGLPVSNAEVLDLTGGESANTDALGNFEIAAKPGNGKVELLLRTSTFESIVELADASDGATIEVTLEVNSMNASVSVSSFNVVEANDTLQKNERTAADKAKDPVEQAPQVRKVVIQGKFILPEGVPVPGARISANGVSARTDFNGNFKLTLNTSASAVSMDVRYLGIKGQIKIDRLKQNRDLLVNVNLVWRVPSQRELYDSDASTLSELNLNAASRQESLR